MTFVALANGLNVERDPLLTWAPTPPKAEFDMNYFVPHFGEDHEITETKKSGADAEKRLGHFWDVLAPKPDDPKRDYFVPHFGVDSDIAASLKNLKDQEAAHGAWNLPKDEWF